MRSFVLTATGGVFDFTSLTLRQQQPYPLRRDDFAITQSRIHRWMGIAPVRLAEHSVRTYQRCLELSADEDVAACGFLHDASESLMCDVPRPVKARPESAGYLALEALVTEEIMMQFGLGHAWRLPETQRIVRAADDDMLACEIRDCVPALPEGYDFGLGVEPPSHFSFVEPASESEALALFIATWSEIGLPEVGRV